MLEVTVKTLDGRNRTFSVPDDITVIQFKEKIANSIEIESNVQRLIFQGRVLDDEKKINDYDVNGKTIHVVQRPPPQARSQTSSHDAAGSLRGRSHDDRGAFFDPFSMPTDADPIRLQVHIDITQPQQSPAQQRINQVLQMMSSARETLDRLENFLSRGEDVAMETSDENSTQSEGNDDDSQQEATTGGATSNVGGDESSSGTSASAEPQDPPVVSLSRVLEDVLQLNERLLPHLTRYQQLMRDDETLTNHNDELNRAQRLCDLTSETLHYMSHVYHNLSDLVVDMNQPLPRLLRASPPAVLPPLIQHNIPVQAQINMTQVPSAGGIPVPSGGGAVPTQSEQPPVAIPNAGSSNISTANQSSIPMRAGDQTSMPSASETTPLAGTGGGFGSGIRVGAGVPPGNFAARMRLPHDLNVGSMPHVGFPPGFHMFMEMSDDGNMNETPPASAPQGGVASGPQSSSTGSSDGNPPPYSDVGGGGVGGPGMQFPSRDFFQNIVQMAAGAALSGGQAGQQVFVLSQGNMQPITVGSSTVPRPTAPASAAPSTAPTSVAISSSSAGTSTTTTSSAIPFAASARAPRYPVPPPPPRPSFFTGPRMGGIFTAPSMPGGVHFGMPPPGGATQPPGMFLHAGFPAFGGLLPPVDSYLPCHSRHFMDRRGNQPAGAGPQATNDPQTFVGMMSNLVSSMMTSQGTPPPPPPPPSSTAAATPSMTGDVGVNSSAARMFMMPQNLSSQMPGIGIGRGGMIPMMPGFMGFGGRGRGRMTRGGLLIAGQGQPAAATVDASSAIAAAAGGVGGNRDDEVIARIVQGISTQLMQSAFGQQANLSISDFLSSLGNEFNISQGEGLLSDLFNCVTRNLIFSDLMMIFFGHVEPLQRLRQPLHSFVSTNVLNGQEPTEANVHLAVQRLIQNMKHDIEETAAAVPMRDNIDYEKSLTRFIEARLTNVIGIILSSSDGFSQNFYDFCRSSIHEFFNLSRFCLQGGVGSLDALVQNRLEVIASEVNPSIQTWMVQMALQQLHQILPMVAMRDEDIQRYVIYRDAVPAETTVTVTTATAAELSPHSTDSYESASCGIDSSEQTIDDLSSVSHPSNGFCEEKRGGGGGARPRINADILSHLPPPPAADENIEVVLGSEEWHSTVPPEWVPVISRDVVRQRCHSPQSSLSDAYLSGMPSKRRKVMSHEKQCEEFADVSISIPESIRRAANEVGVQPNTSADQLYQDAASSSRLQSAFEHEVSDAIRQRIAFDPDYSSNRFPNIEKFFNAKK